MIHNRLRIRFATILVACLLGACDREDAPTSASPGDPERATPVQSGRYLAEDKGKPGIERPGLGEEAKFKDAVEQEDRDAEAEFASVPGKAVSGSATFEETSTGVVIKVEISGAPAGLKALHIHAQGDCSNVEHDSMGGHFNPTGAEHGLLRSEEHHLGDLGNIRVEPDGTAKLTIIVPGANLKPKDPKTFVNRSLVLHEGTDDGAGESGHSGKPIACASILHT